MNLPLIVKLSDGRYVNLSHIVYAERRTLTDTDRAALLKGGIEAGASCLELTMHYSDQTFWVHGWKAGEDAARLSQYLDQLASVGETHLHPA